MIGRTEFLQGLPRHAVEGREVLTRLGWLSRTPEAFREAILSITIWRVAKPGTEFIHAGDEEGGLFGIARGVAEISFSIEHPDTRVIHLAHPGFWGGNRPLLGRARTLTVVARDEVLWALIPQRAVERLLREEPGFWRYIAEMADDAFQIAAVALADLTRQDSENRAVAVLLRLGGCRLVGPPPGTIADVRVSQTELAAMAVMSRNTFNGIVRDLADRGLIEANYRSIVLTNVPALRRMLDDD